VRFIVVPDSRRVTSPTTIPRLRLRQNVTDWHFGVKTSLTPCALLKVTHDQCFGFHRSACDMPLDPYHCTPRQHAGTSYTLYCVTTLYLTASLLVALIATFFHTVEFKFVSLLTSNRQSCRTWDIEQSRWLARRLKKHATWRYGTYERFLYEADCNCAIK
jgi:hypothetical protein